MLGWSSYGCVRLTSFGARYKRVVCLSKLFYLIQLHAEFLRIREKNLSQTPLRSRRTNISSQSQTPLVLHAFPGADDQKAGGSTTSASGLITLVHITRSTVSLQQASQQGPLYCTPNHQKGDGTQRCLPAVRLVARHGCRMEEASAIHSHQGWAGMDGCNEQRLLAAVQAGRANREWRFCRPASRWQWQLRAKAWEKGWCRQPPPANVVSLYSCRAAAVAVVMSAGILLRRG